MRYKRIQNEMLRVPYDIICPEDSSTDMMVEIPHIQGRMKMSKFYPFQAPTLYVNGIDYVNVLLSRYTKLVLVLSHYGVKLQCPCCDHIACQWTPVYGIAEMVQEYERLSWQFIALEMYVELIPTLPFDDGVTACVLSFL